MEKNLTLLSYIPVNEEYLVRNGKTFFYMDQKGDFKASASSEEWDMAQQVWSQRIPVLNADLSKKALEIAVN